MRRDMSTKQAKARPQRHLAILVLVVLIGLTELDVSAQRIPATARVTHPTDVFPKNTKLARQLSLAKQELTEEKYRVGLRRLGLLVGSEI